MKYVKMTIMATLVAAALAAYGCGGGGTSCTAPTQECNGRCVNMTSDVNNCGSCGHVCPTGQQCLSGVCSVQCIPAAEQCDGLDNDCDTQIDENVTRDCSNPCGTGTQSCSDGAWGACSAPSPTTEICDTLDNDCDGAIDEDVKTRYYRDSDGDSYGDTNTFQEACTQPAGYILDHTDCDDSQASIRPGNPELCTNTADDDCDGTVNEGCTCTAGTHQQCGEGGETGDCEWGDQTCQGDGTWGACTGGQRPLMETCNGTDENCNGQIDDGLLEDSYEVNDTCAQARGLPNAEESNTAPTVVGDGTLYSTDGTDDTDWYTIYAHEGFHLCTPGDPQCYFYFVIDFAPPAGTDHTRYSMCLYTTSDTCATWDTTFCTEEDDWESDVTGAYTMALRWEGVCVLTDSWTFYVQIDGATDEENCHPYSLSYQLIYTDEVCE